MAGYWPSSFFACLWTETESRFVNAQKKNEDNIQPSWSNKLGQSRILSYGFRGDFSCATQPVDPSGQDSSILAHSGSQSPHRI